MASNSAIRAATDSASLPMRATQLCPVFAGPVFAGPVFAGPVFAGTVSGLQCGSQRAHSQLARPAESVST